MKQFIAIEQLEDALGVWSGRQVVVHDEGGGGETIRIVHCDSKVDPLLHEIITLSQIDRTAWPTGDNLISGTISRLAIEGHSLRFFVGEHELVISLNAKSSLSKQPFFEHLRERGL